MSEPVSEILTPKPAVKLEGTRLTSIGATPLEVQERRPLSETPFPPTICVAIVPSSTAGLEEFKDTVITLIQPSRHHARSYEIPADGQPLWQDEYGIVYGTTTVKGNNLEDSKVEKDSNASLGLRVHGMQDDREIERIIRVSKVLRETGIETEKIEAVIRPDELIWEGRKVSIDEFKKLLLERAIAEKGVEKLSLVGSGEKVIRDGDVPTIKSWLDSTEFVFTLRDQQVSLRPRDFLEIHDETAFTTAIASIFSFINKRESIEASIQGREARILDPNNPEDIQYYFTDYLPKRLAINIAKLHNAGLTHGFLSGHNVSMAGSIYDLDSIYGQALGDDIKPNPAEDMELILGGLAQLFFRPKSMGSLPHYFQTTYGKSFAPLFFQKFVSTYLEHRHFTFDQNTVIDQTLLEFEEEARKMSPKELAKELKREEAKHGPLDLTLRKNMVYNLVMDFIDLTFGSQYAYPLTVSSLDWMPINTIINGVIKSFEDRQVETVPLTRFTEAVDRIRSDK